MMLLAFLIVLFFSLLFLIVKSIRKGQQNKTVSLYIRDYPSVRAPSFINRFIAHFGKDYSHELEKNND